MPVQSPKTANGSTELPVIPDEILNQKLAAERTRLEKEEGIYVAPAQHFKKPVELRFTRGQRESTTILFGGLTVKHERLIAAVLTGLGYKVQALATADVPAYQLGKEYGNNGQCNPTYFTVGNLVKHLQNLRESGLTTEEINNQYVYLTAGNSCGTCRFAMYEAEYRLALRNSGFEGFRVLTFQLQGGLSQTGDDGPGLELNFDFFLGLINAIIVGDLLNDVGYQIRPYEANPGETNRVLDECMKELSSVMENYTPYQAPFWVQKFLKKDGRAVNLINKVGELASQLYGSKYTDALKTIADRINAIEVDRTRVKPLVKITGEFWAHITEGEGNFNMFPFLESEGAQVLIEPVGSLLPHIIRQIKDETRDRIGINIDPEKDRGWVKWKKTVRDRIKSLRKIWLLTLTEKAFERKWNHLRRALNNLPHGLLDQYELQRLAHHYYNSNARGGESHLEIAKNIYYHQEHLCHMVLSLKPFGCMPSTQSDGVQAAVINHFRDITFLPIETAGEGEINAHSRVQMALGEAKAKAKEEFARVLEETGLTLTDLQSELAARSELKRPLNPPPHAKETVGTAANFARQVALLKGRNRSTERGAP